MQPGLGPGHSFPALRNRKAQGDNTGIIRTRIAGEAQYSDGQSAGIQSVGTEGIDENLLLDTIQLHPEDADLTPEQFRHRFPVGIWLDIWTTIEVSLKTDGNKCQPRAGDTGAAL